jgi:hypothetical protein
MNDVVNISVVDPDSLNSSDSMNPDPGCESGSGYVCREPIELGSNPELQH